MRRSRARRRSATRGEFSDALGAFASGGCINLGYPPQAPGQDERCGIQDANGLWLVHPDLGHREAWALTPQLMQSRTAEGHYALHRLPDLALLHSGLTAIDLFPDDQLIRARRSDDQVAITVADDGEGLNAKNSGTGIGLKNVRERLRLVYDGAAALAVVANFPAGVASTITVPAATEAVRHG